MVTAMSFSRARFAIWFEMVFMWRATNRRNALCQSFPHYQYIQHKISVLSRVQTDYFYNQNKTVCNLSHDFIYLMIRTLIRITSLSVIFFNHVDNKHRHCISFEKMVDDNNNENLNICVILSKMPAYYKKALYMFFLPIVILLMHFA